MLEKMCSLGWMCGCETDAAGFIMAIFHLMGSLVQSMGTVSHRHSYRMMIAESYAIIFACTEMFVDEVGCFSI
jgi:hypothetical protein